MPSRRCGRASALLAEDAEHARRDVRKSAAAVAPRARERRDAGDRAVGDRRAGVTLCADAQADEGRLVLGERARELAQVGRPGRRSAPRGRLRLAGQALDQLVVAECVRATPSLVGEPCVEQRAHDAERERRVGAWQGAEVHVGDAGRAAAEGIDDDQPRAAAARLEDQLPEVRRRGERIPAPHDDRAGVHPLLGIDLGRGAVRRHRARNAGARADRAHERGSADRVEQAVGHHVALHQSLRAEIAVGDDGRAAMPRDRRLEAARSGVEGLVPGHLPEATLALGPRAHQRMQEALVRVHALEVVRHLAAQEAGRDGVIAVALDARRAAIGVDLDEQGARVGTIVRAGPADDSGNGVHGDFDPTRRRGLPAGNSLFPLRIV